MGRHVLRLLKFVIAYRGWHSLSHHDPAAKRAVLSLAAKGIVEWNEPTYQFRLVEAKVEFAE